MSSLASFILIFLGRPFWFDCTVPVNIALLCPSLYKVAHWCNSYLQLSDEICHGGLPSACCIHQMVVHAQYASGFWCGKWYYSNIDFLHDNCYILSSPTGDVSLFLC